MLCTTVFWMHVFHKRKFALPFFVTHFARAKIKDVLGWSFACSWKLWNVSFKMKWALCIFWLDTQQNKQNTHNCPRDLSNWWRHTFLMNGRLSQLTSFANSGSELNSSELHWNSFCDSLFATAILCHRIKLMCRRKASGHQATLKSFAHATRTKISSTRWKHPHSFSAVLAQCFIVSAGKSTSRAVAVHNGSLNLTATSTSHHLLRVGETWPQKLYKFRSLLQWECFIWRHHLKQRHLYCPMQQANGHCLGAKKVVSDEMFFFCDRGDIGPKTASFQDVHSKTKRRE